MRVFVLIGSDCEYIQGDHILGIYKHKGRAERELAKVERAYEGPIGPGVLELHDFRIEEQWYDEEE